ncbi:MAG: hypothetical protein IJ794_16925 [Lachnospiraceae bacterium]|nr:hypothetical protein [Lachnospiraceae bacterium]
MLSKEDYSREIGKNIFIYPLEHVRILGNSIDLTASRFAWTANGKYIYNESSGLIEVPPHETACIITNEALYVKAKIGGTYHSRVSIAQKGFSHIGTMLDPEFFGQSLIILHNTTAKVLTINVKDHERIVSVIFYYLETPILVESHKPNPGHIDKLNNYERIDEYIKWRDQHRWATEKRELVDTFITSEEFKKYEERKKRDEQEWGNTFTRFKKGIERYLKSNIASYIILLVICFIIFKVCTYFFPQMDDNTKAMYIATVIVVLINQISIDLKSKP